MKKLVFAILVVVVPLWWLLLSHGHKKTDIVQLTLTNTCNAIASYEHKQQRAAQSLDEVVPRFIENVPNDPWGTALRLNGREVISCGEDATCGTADDIRRVCPSKK